MTNSNDHGKGIARLQNTTDSQKWDEFRRIFKMMSQFAVETYQWIGFIKEKKEWAVWEGVTSACHRADVQSLLRPTVVNRRGVSFQRRHFLYWLTLIYYISVFLYIVLTSCVVWCSRSNISYWKSIRKNFLVVKCMWKKDVVINKSIQKSFTHFSKTVKKVDI